MDIFLKLLLSITLTAIAYLLVPVIISLAYKDALSRKIIIIITVVNGIIVFFLFRIGQTILYGYSNISMNTFPATVWSGIAYAVLKATRYNINLFPNVCDALQELDEARNHFESIKFDPIYSYVSEHLKVGRYTHEKEILSQRKSPRQYVYQMIYDAADRELHTKDHIPGYMERHRPFYQEVQAYARDQANIVQPQAPIENLSIKADIPEITVPKEIPPDKPRASSPIPRNSNAHHNTQYLRADLHPFGNAMEALVELGLAKCQHQSASFQPIYQTVKQRLEADMAETEAQIRCSGKTPKEFVYQMIVDEIDHLKQVGAQHEKS